MRHAIFAAMGLTACLSAPAIAATSADAPELDACKASGLIAVKEHSPAVKAITLDPDTVSVSKTKLMIEGTEVKSVVMGLATLDTAKAEKPHQFVCLIGDKGKVLMTFFTQK